jgi:hypothetical protein
MANVNPEDLTADHRLFRAPDVAFAEVDGEGVLLQVGAGVYYGLNQTATRLWCLADEGVTLGSAHEALLRDYDVMPDVLWRDICAVVRQLAENDLVVIEPAPATGEGDE